MRTLAERVAMFKRELGLDGTDQGGGSNRRRPHSWGRPETKGRNRSLTSPTTGQANTLIVCLVPGSRSSMRRVEGVDTVPRVGGV